MCKTVHGCAPTNCDGIQSAGQPAWDQKCNPYVWVWSKPYPETQVSVK